MPPKKQQRLGEGQQTLLSLFKDRQDELSTTEADSVTESSTESSTTAETSQTPSRKFHETWLQLYPWLHYEDNKMTCDVCVKASRNNTFTKGNTNFKTSSLRDHVKGKDHQTALLVPQLQENLKNLQSKQLSAKEKAAYIALQSLYWIVQENVSLSKFSSFLNFLKRVGVVELNALSVSKGLTYESDYAAHEFLKALSDTIEDETTKSLTNSPCVTALADESTDRTVTHRLVIYAQAIDPLKMQPITKYLTNIQLDSGTGAAVSEAIYGEFEKRGVKYDKIMGLGSDGASAMTGKDKGTTGMMLRKNPHLTNVHCIAHRLALCTSQAAESVPALKSFQEVITSVFYYFKYSPLRTSKLKALQDVLHSPQLKFKEVHSVRWMSFYSALEAVYRSLDPLLTYLAQSPMSDAKAQGLKKKIGTLKFISLAHILMDIIPVVTKLNLFFQKEITDIALIKVKIEECLNSLKGLMETKGPHETELEKSVQSNFYFEHSISSCSSEEIQSAKTKFLVQLQENIQRRFPDTGILAAFGILGLRPITFIKAEELADWGTDQLEVLIGHYGQTKTHSWKEDGENKSVSRDPIIDANATRNEFTSLKETVIAQMYPRDNVQHLWSLISSFHGKDYPNLCSLACLALTCPVNTAGCERGFSVQNQALTPLRNRLSPETQDMLMRVMINGATLDEFDFRTALGKWKSQADRYLFK